MITVKGEDLRRRRLEAGHRSRLSEPARRRLQRRWEATAASQPEVDNPTTLCRTATVQSTAHDSMMYDLWPFLDSVAGVEKVAGASVVDLLPEFFNRETAEVGVQAGEAADNAADCRAERSYMEAGVQAAVVVRTEAAQTEGDYVDGTSGLIPGMDLAAAATAVREMDDTPSFHKVDRLVCRYGLSARSQIREMHLIVRAMMFAQRDLVQYVRRRLLEIRDTAPSQQTRVQFLLVDELERLGRRTVMLD